MHLFSPAKQGPANRIFIERPVMVQCECMCSECTFKIRIEISNSQIRRLDKLWLSAELQAA